MPLTQKSKIRKPPIMSVRGTLYVVNTSGSDLEIHVQTKEGFKFFRVKAGQTKKGSRYKISSHNCTPFREFKPQGVVLIKGESNPVWKSKWKYICLAEKGHAPGGVIIIDNPAGKGVLVESINAGKIVQFLRDYFEIKVESDAPIESTSTQPWTQEESVEQEDDDPEE
ncbi:hypothetical protein OKA04_12890 [Luteolibacter flavescens]|uniref:Uncharacterized protein n=1 Tax=Luteolibacter flavescens TaxID=1859460 RepID=A0ABT3FPW7_9BACT|nr:hypothetical protein [Luteolibacter flavescens]MCW1885628.1 hypothetical protein [Luteolibacter flavescens]